MSTIAMQRIDAGVDLSFRIGQRVRHQDYKGKRVTGVVRGLSIDSEQGLMVSIALDAPIVIETGVSRPIDIWDQTAPAHEFAPFDDRDELIADMLGVLRMVDDNNRVDAGEKRKAWSGSFVAAEVRRVLGPTVVSTDQP